MPIESAARTTRPRPRNTAATTTGHAAHGPTEDQIRRRAYEIYQARGNRPGSPEADWRQAEQELRSRQTLLGKS